MKFLPGLKVATLATVALTTFSIRPLFAQTTAPTFSDTDGNVYEEDIEKAAKMGIVKGFPGGTFRPDEKVTREQAAVMIVKAIGKVTKVDLNDKPREFPPFNDLPADRWSAPSIYWLQSHIYPANTAQLTGNFRPEAYITRAGLVQLLKWTAELVSIKLNASAELVETQEPVVFADVHGADKVLTMQMSAFCNVATALNEEGENFFPLKPANRDYVTAAIVRAVECPSSPSSASSN